MSLRLRAGRKACLGVFMSFPGLFPTEELLGCRCRWAEMDRFLKNSLSNGSASPSSSRSVQNLIIPLGAHLITLYPSRCPKKILPPLKKTCDCSKASWTPPLPPSAGKQQAGVSTRAQEIDKGRGGSSMKPNQPMGSSCWERRTNHHSRIFDAFNVTRKLLYCRRRTVLCENV